MRALLVGLWLIGTLGTARADSFVWRTTVMNLPGGTGATAQFTGLSGTFASTTAIGTNNTDAAYVVVRPIIIWRMDCAEDVTHGGAFNRVYTLQSCATSGCTPANLSPSVTCTTVNSCAVPTCNCSTTLANGSLVGAGSRMVLKIAGSSNSLNASNATCEVTYTYQ